MCRQEDVNRRCLSTGECRICKFVEATALYEGCDITSTTPICDADETTTKVNYDTDDYLAGNTSMYAPEAGVAHLETPKCVACKKAGNMHPSVI